MKGFTLIELLAVIVILALILVIAVPQINKTITDSKKKSFESDAKIVLSQLDIKLLDKSLDILSIDETNIESILGIKDDNYDSIKLTKINGSPYILIQGKNKWNGLMAYGTYDNITVSTDTSYNTILNRMGYNSSKGVNEPVLSKGMTPIKWDGTKWINTTEDDSSWYNYTDKKWANARTQDGSMWVWIPRYIYRITSGWHSNTTGTIEVQFSMGTDDTRGNTVTLDTGTTSNASNNKWTNHPGFTFGSTEVTGIWVAKFEPTAVEGIENTNLSDWSCSIANDNLTTKTVKIIPNAISWRCISVGNMFTVSRLMETKSVYGWNVADTLKNDGTYTTDNNNVDVHLMKNIEWGTIAYLSKSSYGKNTDKIWINNNQNFVTGCSGNSVSASGYDGCQNEHYTTNGVQASTTGSIYGIYDLNGSAWEHTSAYLNNGNANLTLNGLSITNADNKYKDVYSKGVTDTRPNNYLLAINKKGDAIYEISSSGDDGLYGWFAEYSDMPNTSIPWLIRGGRFGNTNISGTFFLSSMYGLPDNRATFRPVLLVGTDF